MVSIDPFSRGICAVGNAVTARMIVPFVPGATPTLGGTSTPAGGNATNATNAPASTTAPAPA
jgi:hypothetical protein